MIDNFDITGPRKYSDEVISPSNINTGVSAASSIPAQATGGPYPGDFVFGRNTIDECKVAFLVQVKCRNGLIISDAESSADWLRLIQPARDRHEQNCEFYREQNGEIFIQTIKSLEAGEQLVAWYSDQLARDIGVPFLGLHNIFDNQHYICEDCGKSYTHPNPLKAHIRFRCLKRQKTTKRWSNMLDRPDGKSNLFRPYLNCNCDSESAKTALTIDTKAPRIPEMPYISSYFDRNRFADNKFMGPKFESRISSIFGDNFTCNPKRAHLSDYPMNLSIRDMKSTAKMTSLNANLVSQPIQIFNHIQPQVFPFPMETISSQYRCCRLWNPLALLSRNSNKGYHHLESSWNHVPKSVEEPHIPLNRPANEKETTSPGLNLQVPLPSETDGEPLDLLPKSFFANKSKKGHLCIYCGKLYSRKYGLKIHLRTHTGYKPLKCKVCMRPFGDPSNLNKHIRLHADGDTPYRCEFCGKVLVRRRDLERHVKSRHPNETLNCGNSEKNRENQEDDFETFDQEPELIVV